MLGSSTCVVWFIPLDLPYCVLARDVRLYLALHFRWSPVLGWIPSVEYCIQNVVQGLQPLLGNLVVRMLHNRVLPYTKESCNITSTLPASLGIDCVLKASVSLTWRSCSTIEVPLWRFFLALRRRAHARVCARALCPIIEENPIVAWRPPALCPQQPEGLHVAS